MRRGQPLLVALIMADDVFFRQVEQLAEIDAELHGLLINGEKIRGVRQAVLADFKADVCIVGRAARVPAAHIPRQRLVSGNRAVCQLADERMDADLSPIRLRLIPVVAAGAEQAVVWADIPAQIGIVAAGRVDHDAFRLHVNACTIAVVLCKIELMQIHPFCPPARHGYAAALKRF